MSKMLSRAAIAFLVVAAGYYMIAGGSSAYEPPGKQATRPSAPAPLTQSRSSAESSSRPASNAGLGADPRTARPDEPLFGKTTPTQRAAEPRTLDPEPSLRTAKDIERHFDRLKMQALDEYVRSGDRPDFETAYMILFNVVIEHDLFQDCENIADRYLNQRTDGAVTPLARAIKSMALAGRKQFTEAANVYAEMTKDVTPQNVRFAWSFGDSLARQAAAAGDYPAARNVYSIVAKKFPDEAELQQEIKSHLKKIERVGEPAPAFGVTDLDGKKLSLADLRGKIVLIDFWATWCAPCVAELPDIRAVYDRFHDRGFEVVGVSLDEKDDAVRAFVREHELPWRQLVNRGEQDGDIVGRYGVDQLPASFLIDGDGKVQRVDLRGDALEKAVTELLGRRTAARTEPPPKK